MHNPITFNESLEARLGFTIPPFRPPYETWKTDYGIGLVGLHWVMQIMHLPAYRAARFRTVAACEIDPQRVAETHSKGYDVGPIDEDFRKMVKRPEVDVVDSTFGHLPEKLGRRIALVEACAEAGKPVMIHKPVASILDVAEKMARIAEEAGIWLAVNQDCRYNPANYTVKHLLTPERLGRPNLIEVQNYWRGDPKSFESTGAWMQHMVHHADLIRWWVGKPCIAVYAKSACRSTMTLYEFADGTLVYHMENHTGVEHHETRIRVTAEKGVIRAGHNWNWHYPSAQGLDFVEVFRDTHEPAIPLPLPEHVYEPPWTGINKWIPSSGPYYDLAAPIAGMMGSMGCLMHGLETNTPPDNHVSGAIESLRMCLAAELSVKTGRPVDPREVPSDTETVN